MTGETDDEAAYRLTACYAAGRCQGDLGCPGLAGHCARNPAADPGYCDDEFDDERW